MSEIAHKLRALNGFLDSFGKDTPEAKRLELTKGGEFKGEIIFARARWKSFFGREEIIKVIYAADCEEEGWLIKATPHIYADHTIVDKVLQTPDWDGESRLELRKGTLETLVPYEQEEDLIEWRHVAKVGPCDIFLGNRHIYIERPDCVDGDLSGWQSYLGVKLRDFCGLCPIGVTHLYDTDPL